MLNLLFFISYFLFLISVLFLFHAVYVGNLLPIFSAFSSLAKKEDIFIFTVENNEQISEIEITVDVDSVGDRSIPGKDKKITSSDTKKIGKWNLQKSGRFAHSEEYLNELVSSFSNLKMISLTKIIPR